MDEFLNLPLEKDWGECIDTVKSPTNFHLCRVERSPAPEPEHIDFEKSLVSDIASGELDLLMDPPVNVFEQPEKDTQSHTVVPQDEIMVLKNQIRAIDTRLVDYDQAQLRFSMIFDQAVQRLDGVQEQILKKLNQNNKVLEDNKRIIQALVTEAGQERIRELLQSMQINKDSPRQFFGGNRKHHRNNPEGRSLYGQQGDRGVQEWGRPMHRGGRRGRGASG
jgi:hypothetical protein